MCESVCAHMGLFWHHLRLQTGAHNDPEYVEINSTLGKFHLLTDQWTLHLNRLFGPSFILRVEAELTHIAETFLKCKSTLQMKSRNFCFYFLFYICQKCGTSVACSFTCDGKEHSVIKMGFQMTFFQSKNKNIMDTINKIQFHATLGEIISWKRIMIYLSIYVVRHIPTLIKEPNFTSSQWFIPSLVK